MKLRSRAFLLLTLVLSTFFYSNAEAVSSTRNIQDPSIDMNMLRLAWRINTGGSNDTPYYDLRVNGERFKGERQWATRWNLIKDALPYEGKRILELGSNIACSSVFLLKYKGAQSATAVDLPNDRLTFNGTPNLMKAASLFHKAFGVQVKMVQADFDASNYESILGKDYDVVVCMSLLNWVQDKGRLLTYLSNFPNVIFEGHEADEVEIQRFKNVGFTSYTILGTTQTGVSYAKDHKRTLILFSK